ncbi:MAG: GNAT family N-acetyltransferase [Blastocatellia bacterium]
MTISIRPATTEDIPALERLIPVSVRGLSAGYYTPRQIESALVYVFGVDTQLIADGTYFVAEADGEIAGCGGWSKRRTLYGGDQMKAEADPLLDPATDAARIRAFFIHPHYARRGIGTLIINACEDAAREAGFSRLELMATLPGLPMYEARGYTVIEKVESVLPDGERLPLARMGKRLEG